MRGKRLITNVSGIKYIVREAKEVKMWSKECKTASADREVDQLGGVIRRKPVRDPSSGERNQSRARII